MVAGIHGHHEEAGVVTGKTEDMERGEGEREVMEAEEGERGDVAQGEAGVVDGQTMRVDPVKAGTDRKLQSLIRFSLLGIVHTIRRPCDLKTCYLFHVKSFDSFKPCGNRNQLPVNHLYISEVVGRTEWTLRHCGRELLKRM